MYSRIPFFQKKSLNRGQRLRVISPEYFLSPRGNDHLNVTWHSRSASLSSSGTWIMTLDATRSLTMVEFKSFVMNNNACNVFYNSQKSFRIFLRCSSPNNRGYRHFSNSTIVYWFTKLSLVVYKNLFKKNMPLLSWKNDQFSGRKL